MRTTRKGFIPPLFMAIVAILLVGGGAYLYTQNKPASQSAMVQNSDWKTYTNTQYGFEFKYPDINARLKTVGGWTDTNEPKITSKTPFNYDECVSIGEDYGEGSKITIAGREYCLITISGVEVGTFSSQYEYISRIANEDIGIVFSFSGNRGTGGQRVNQEAESLFEQILSTTEYLGGGKVTNISAIPGGIFAGDNVLIVSDSLGVKWTVNYKNAKYSEYSEAWEGMPDQQFVDWIKNNKKTWVYNQTKPEGFLHILGILDEDGIFNASKITQFLTDPAGTVPNGAE